MWSCLVRSDSDTRASSLFALPSSIRKATVTERFLTHAFSPLALLDTAHHLVQLACDRQLRIGEQMDVAMCHSFARMAEARCDGRDRHSHRHEHRRVAVAQLVDADALHLRRLGTARHLVMEEMLRHARKDPRVQVRRRVQSQILFELFDEKGWHGHRAVRVRGLRRVEDILVSHTGDGFADPDLRGAKVYIRRSESEHLSYAKTAPEQYLEGDMGIGFVCDRVGEAQVLLLGPNAHFALLLRPDLPGDADVVARESVEAHEMVHDRRQLAAERVQVVCRVGLALGYAAFREMVLPVYDGLGVDVSDQRVAEVRLEHPLDVVALLFQSRLSDSGRIIVEINIACESELHGRSLRHSLLEVPLPALGLAFRSKSSLGLSLGLTFPVLVSEVDELGLAFLIFVSRHRFSFSVALLLQHRKGWLVKMNIHSISVNHTNTK